MVATADWTSWVVVPAPKPAAARRLIAFPYGGGGASIFARWPAALPPDVELCAVQMPGREGRLGEPAITRWEDIHEQLVAALAPWIDRPCALFGHSLGSILAFEVARQLPASCQGYLTHLFASGRRAPHVPLVGPPTHDLPEPEFVEQLKGLAGTPVEVLENPEMLSVYLPLLRADFGLSETYVYRPSDPLTVPITAFGGTQDERAPERDVDAWRLHTTGAFQRLMFPGGHFFLTERRSAVIASLVQALGTAPRA
jgi:medium-chain acyl-[acyl-carrier-protein] hydrolase